MKNFTVQFMHEMNMKWRKDGTKKTFMERLVNLAAERVRRGLMPNLRKKVRTAKKYSKSHNNKRYKTTSSYRSFDPDIHVKDENSTNASNMDSMTVTTNDDRDVSSITDKEQEQSVISMLRKYYEENKTSELPQAVFEAYVNAKPGYVTNMQDSLSPSTINCGIVVQPRMTEENDNNAYATLEDVKYGTDLGNKEGHVHVDFNIVPNNILNPGTGTIVQNLPPLCANDEKGNETLLDANDTALMNPFHRCTTGNCEFKMEINSNPHESTIKKDFGPGMKCVAANCGKTLFECFKMKHVGGAYVCVQCKDGGCKHMYCCSCFETTPHAKKAERTRRGRKMVSM